MFDRKYRMAIQCSLWDRIKDIESLKTTQQSHLALFVSHLIKEKLLSLACLKVNTNLKVFKVKKALQTLLL